MLGQRQHRMLPQFLVAALIGLAAWAQNPDVPPEAADAAKAKRHPAQAAALYERYLRDHPQSSYCPQVRLDLADCHLAGGNPAKAVETLGAAPPNVQDNPHLYVRWLRVCAQAFMAAGEDSKAEAIREQAYALSASGQIPSASRELFEDYYYAKLGSAPSFAAREIARLVARGVFQPHDAQRMAVLRLACLESTDPKTYQEEGMAFLLGLEPASHLVSLQKGVALSSRLYPRLLSAGRLADAARVFAHMETVLAAGVASDLTRTHRAGYLDAMANALPKALPPKPGSDVARLYEAYWAVWEGNPSAAAAHAGALLTRRWRDDPRADQWWPRFVALVDALPADDPARPPALWARAQTAYYRSLRPDTTPDQGQALLAQAVRDAEGAFAGGADSAPALEAATWLMGQYREAGRAGDADDIVTRIARLLPTRETLAWLAEYWMQAESADASKRAAGYWQALLKAAPADRDMPLWLYRLGLCQERLGDRTGARASFARVVQEYENAPAAPMAVRGLARLTEDDR